MQTVGSFEAKTHLSSLLERVARGERITITRHGTPIAMLVPVASSEKREPRELGAAIRKLRKNHSLGNLSIKHLINRGRRF